MQSNRSREYRNLKSKDGTSYTFSPEQFKSLIICAIDFFGDQNDKGTVFSAVLNEIFKKNTVEVLKFKEILTNLKRKNQSVNLINDSQKKDRYVSDVAQLLNKTFNTQYKVNFILEYEFDELMRLALDFYDKDQTDAEKYASFTQADLSREEKNINKYFFDLGKKFSDRITTPVKAVPQQISKTKAKPMSKKGKEKENNKFIEASTNEPFETDNKLSEPEKILQSLLETSRWSVKTDEASEAQKREKYTKAVVKGLNNYLNTAFSEKKYISKDNITKGQVSEDFAENTTKAFSPQIFTSLIKHAEEYYRNDEDQEHEVLFNNLLIEAYNKKYKTFEKSNNKLIYDSLRTLLSRTKHSADTDNIQADFINEKIQLKKQIFTQKLVNELNETFDTSYQYGNSSDVKSKNVTLEMTEDNAYFPACDKFGLFSPTVSGCALAPVKEPTFFEKFCKIFYEAFFPASNYLTLGIAVTGIAIIAAAVIATIVLSILEIAFVIALTAPAVAGALGVALLFLGIVYFSANHHYQPAVEATVSPAIIAADRKSSHSDDLAELNEEIEEEDELQLPSGEGSSNNGAQVSSGLSSRVVVRQGNG